MHNRFYAPDLDCGAATVRLPADEARHLARVLRLRVGDPVRVFNGRGLQCGGRVAAIGRDEVSIDVGGQVQAAREARTGVTLAQAVLKGDSMDLVVRDAVMLGVVRIVPMLTAHAEGDRRGQAAAARQARWQRIAVASAKQCGRAVVPTVEPPMSLAGCLATVPADRRIALLEPSCLFPATTAAGIPGQDVPGAATLFVGPEGGWADEELHLLAASQVEALTLGPWTLRAEAAATVGLSALHVLWGEFAPAAAR